MKTVNIHQAKTHLSKLIAKAAEGESFIIAKAGKPMVRVTSMEEPAPKKMQRIGFMKGQFNVPDDFDTMMQQEIAEMFYGSNKQE